MKIKTYLLAICLVLNVCNLKALDHAFEPAGTIAALEERINEGRRIAQLMIYLNSLPPEERIEDLAIMGWTEEMYDNNVQVLPEMLQIISRLELRLSIMKNNLYMRAQGA